MFIFNIIEIKIYPGTGIKNIIISMNILTKKTIMKFYGFSRFLFMIILIAVARF